MSIKSGKTPELTATLRPGDFLLGSTQSRAVVRMRLLKLRKVQRRETIIFHAPRPHRDPMRYHFTGWSGNPESGFRRFVFAPCKYLDPGDSIPVCPDCGKPFRKDKETSGKISYVGDCLDAHDPDL